MSILLMTPKLHRFRFQNYNTHPIQNDVVLAINFFFFKKNVKIKIKNKKKKDDENRELLEPPPNRPSTHSRPAMAGHPILAKGVVAGATPDFHLSFFFDFHLFFKKIYNKIMAKTTSFWVGRVL
jgi:hypothetical protein